MNTTYNGRELNDREYKIYLEGVAYGIWRALMTAGAYDGYHKSCDPLMFSDGLEDGEDEVYSYVFDLWDGGRHHKFESLEQVMTGLLEELKLLTPTPKGLDKRV